MKPRCDATLARLCRRLKPLRRALRVLLATAVAGPAAAGSGPTLPLPAADREMIERNLGKGVVGAPVPAPVIDDPARWFRLAPGAAAYKVVHGPREGDLESFRLSADPRSSGSHRWRYHFGEEEVGLLEVRPDGSYVLAGTHAIKDGAVTRYNPPEPLLLKGLAPGEERRQRMEVRVYDADSPDEVTYEGLLSVAHRYVGAYRFTGPAGSYDAILTKSTFSGHVGPAELEDTQYRFFAPKVGVLAAIERRSVSALLVYRTNMEVARMLAEPGR
jgi:hypothetical protein